ncbi:hypothetical protein FPOAC1_008765 [Fusarium poae]|uniref:hypothetical protein n=1 Tax=Fusarium poae TaxID=36050 RepID=UPI001CE8FA4C|nr:hypothetical protein FPOAC1_008765 [Fusarium poae]KAG8669371.1 hypothetical protein FPOAC1_008765 [Fusarium poae]
MACFCKHLDQLIDNFDPSSTARFASNLNKHLEAIRSILAKNKSLSKEVRYQVIPSNQRTAKILSLQSITFDRVRKLHDTLQSDTKAFWTSKDDSLLQELRRRVACVTIFLRSKVNDDAWIANDVAAVVKGRTLSELRYAGNKYIKIARKLGGVGSILWLPLEVPASTYERYLNMDDTEAFDHLHNLGSEAPDLNYFVQSLITEQLNDSSLNLSFRNLLLEYGYCFLPSEQGLLLLHTLGGTEVPVDLLKSVKIPMRRWTNEGEIQSISAIDFGLSSDLVTVLSSDDAVSQLQQRPEVTQKPLEDGAVTLSLHPQAKETIASRLSPQAVEDWETTALRLICFACPPCYEGKVNWSLPTKKSIWALLDKLTSQKRITTSLRTCVIEALLYFCERDLFSIRLAAIQRAKTLVRKNMPFYYQASVTLFDSIISGKDGDFERSNAIINEFLSSEQCETNTRSDNALRGRLHISSIENKIHRLAEIHCELHEYEKALQIIQVELDTMSVKKGRPFRRLTMAMGEAYIGLGQFYDADSILKELIAVEPPELDDLNDQVLKMRRLILSARIQHERCDFVSALLLWTQAGQQMQGLSTFSSRHGWIAAIIKLSMAHAQIAMGDSEAGRKSWDAAVAVAMRERFEFVFPILATTWLQKIVGEIHQAKGWPLRIMMPGGKSDLTWL